MKREERPYQICESKETDIERGRLALVAAEVIEEWYVWRYARGKMREV